MPTLPKQLQSAPIGRERLAPEVQAEYQRERILDAATEVFAKRGYQGTTIDHIVSAAKVGVGRVYSFFDGKEACFLAVYDRVVANGRERMVEATASSGSWTESLTACLRVLLEMMETAPLEMRIALIEVQTAGSAALERHERLLEEAAGFLREARKHSPVPDQLPKTLEFATVGGLVWFLQQRIALGESENAAGLLPEVMEIVIAPFIGTEATADLVAAS
jgi:AcrR family transcriptional regulator